MAQKGLCTFYIKKQIDAVDLNDALRRESHAKIVEVSQDANATDQGLTSAIGFLLSDHDD